MNEGGKKHAAAQQYIYEILKLHYKSVSKEVLCPVPNPKYMLDSTEKPILPYFLDIVAIAPNENCGCESFHLGLEIDGAVGHKKTRRQYVKDRVRQSEIEKHYPEITFIRFDPEQVIGKGYINPKTKQLTPVKTEPEILKLMGIKCRKYLRS